MAVSRFQAFAFRLLGERAKKSPELPKVEESLRKARMAIRPEAFLAYAWMVAFLTSVVFTVVAALGVWFAIRRFDLPPVLAVFTVVAPGFGWYLGNIAILGDPPSKAKKRGKNIDARLPYATNYIAAMASAGVIPGEIFKSLAKQDVYGEVASEAARIYKDMEVHGMDIVTSMRRAIARTPSARFGDLMQGAITTVTSGGDLTGYFRSQAKSLQFENRVEQRSFTETMGIMAESYVTAAVAGPLFLLVMVAIFVLMGSGKFSMLQLIVFLLMPVINLGFMFGIKSMTPEV